MPTDARTGWLADLRVGSSVVVAVFGHSYGDELGEVVQITSSGRIRVAIELVGIIGAATTVTGSQVREFNADGIERTSAANTRRRLWQATPDRVDRLQHEKLVRTIGAINFKALNLAQLRQIKKIIDTPHVNEHDDFHAGVLAALEVVKLHDQEGLFCEIVERCDADALVDFARRDELLESSGLIRYGFVRPEKQP